MFRLVRTDGSRGEGAVLLARGVQPFGRGVLLGCEDKRVSRRHGQLEVTELEVKLTALHQNPCFIVKKVTKEMQMLRHGSSEHLTIGDKFGLLPDAYWYELVRDAAGQGASDHATSGTDSRSTRDLDNGIYQSLDGNIEEVPAPNPAPVPLEKEAAHQPTRGTVLDEEDQLIDFAASEYEMDNETGPPGPGSPSLIAQNNESTSGNATIGVPHAALEGNKRAHESDGAGASDASPAKVGRAVPPHVKPGTAALDPAALDPAAVAAGIKREPESEPAGIKREPESEPASIKREPESEPASIKQEPESEPASIKQEPESEPASIKQEPNSEPGSGAPTVAAPVAAGGPGRERCMYGAQCYRRNPQHKLHLSHPGDADWGSGARAECPWGAGCVRRDPRHWRDHSHPPGARPPSPPPPLPGAQRRGPPAVVQRHGSTFYVNAYAVHFHDDHFSVEDDSGDSVDYDYEF